MPYEQILHGISSGIRLFGLKTAWPSSEKESVNELLLLIDGAKAKLNTVTTTKMPAHKIHPVNVSVASAETIPPAKKQPAAHPQLASTTKKSELPLDDDFKDMP